MEDFGADAIISQLLLLDSQDPSKDIKLFINSPGKGDWGSVPLWFGGRIHTTRTTHACMHARTHACTPPEGAVAQGGSGTPRWMRQAMRSTPHASMCHSHSTR